MIGWIIHMGKKKKKIEKGTVLQEDPIFFFQNYLSLPTIIPLSSLPFDS